MFVSHISTELQPGQGFVLCYVTSSAHDITMMSFRHARYEYMSTLKGDGFRAPAEWEPHSACLIGWSWKKSIWQEPAKSQRAFLEVIRAICKAEKVIVIANPGKLLATN